MARFDLYRPASTYLVDVQSNFISGLGTRLVVPLLPPGSVPPPVRRLHPVFAIDGSELVLATHLMGALPERSLGKKVGSLAEHYDQIVAALDMIFLGF